MFWLVLGAAALRPTPSPPLATRRGALALATLAAAAAAAPPRAACAKSDFKWGPMARMSEESGLHALHAPHLAAPLDAPSMHPRCVSLRPRCTLAVPWLYLGCTLAAPPHRRRTLTQAEMDGLDAGSREPDAGVLLPGGVRVIDMVVGDGPTPVEGQRVYAHYKVDGFPNPNPNPNPDPNPNPNPNPDPP